MAEHDRTKEEIKKICELLSHKFHYKIVKNKLLINERTIDLQKRKKHSMFYVFVCATIMAIGLLISIGSFTLAIYYWHVKNIFNILILIALVSSLVSMSIEGILKKCELKNEIYDKKATQNLELFGDYIYDAKRINETIKTKEDNVKNILMRVEQNKLQINNKKSEIIELEKIIEEINCHKSIYDEVINDIYDNNMPAELKAKIAKPFAKPSKKESGKILAKSLFK